MANKKSTPKKIRKRYTFRPTLGSLALFCFGLIFVLAWVFSLGVMVGRNSLPVAIDVHSNKQGGAAVAEEKQAAENLEPITEEELTFYEQLVHKRDSATKEEIPHLSTKQAETKTDVRRTKQAEEPARHYSVQVAAFKDKAKTEQMVARLSSLGYQAYYYQTLIHGEMFYRVRCGPFYSIREAKRYAKRLAESEGFKPFIIYPDNK
jgi:cell division septation protein DedD